VFRKSKMAIVHCRRCKAKITKMDETCRSCGAPTSRIVSFLLYFAVCAAVVVVFMAYRDNVKSADVEVAAAKYKLSKQQTNEPVTYNSEVE